MKKILAALIFIGLITAFFCSSGWMAKTMNSMSDHGTIQMDECCDFEAASGHHAEEIVAISPSIQSFDLPVVLLILALVLTLFIYRLPDIDHFRLPNFYHRFSRGVFQLE